ncbi:MAG: DUF3857 domain-containing protein [Prevotellaceae bacterium]|nr:DUF3857 domain-containing protein [Prevotellaceae bacterium]
MNFRNAFLIICLCVCSAFISAAKGYKYGKIPLEELAMTTYQNDTSASAVVLLKTGTTEFDYRSDGFGVASVFERRVKILTSDGVDYANVEIPFYKSARSNGTCETIFDIEAAAYNLEDGKIVKSKLSKQYIYREKVDENWNVVKFSIPNVKVGTVIEYRYKYSSNNPYSIDSWKIQESVPVFKSIYEVLIPAYYQYRFQTKGYEYIDCQKSTQSRAYDIRFNTGAGYINKTVNVPLNRLVFIADTLPALKDEPFVWCKNEYRTLVDFELFGVQFPGAIFEGYSSSWKKVKELLLEHEYFGAHIKGLSRLKNPFWGLQEQARLDTMDTENQIRSLFQILKSRMQWDGSYTLMSRTISEAIRQGKGSNADLNFVFLRMLSDANIKAYPVLICERDKGSLPLQTPSIDKLTTFVIVAYAPDGKAFYIDGSVEHGDINILPPQLMVSQGAILDLDRDQILDLTSVSKNSTRVNITAQLQPDGTLVGTRQSRYQGQHSSEFKSTLASKGLDTYKQDLEKNQQITITDMDLQQTEGLSSFSSEVVSFEKTTQVSGEYIYVNPMIFPDEPKNVFTSVNRKLPVEFPYLQSVRITVNLDVPEGYIVDEIPKSISAKFEDNKLYMSYVIYAVEDKVQLRYQLDISTLRISSQSYHQLKQFWETLVTKNNAQIVFKKIAK